MKTIKALFCHSERSGSLLVGRTKVRPTDSTQNDKLRMFLRMIILGTFVMIIAEGVCERAMAIPLFARKYNTTCFTCHTTEPLLNDFGRKFQANGYQLPGSSSVKEAQSDQTTFPLGLLSQPMIGHARQIDNLAGTPTTSSTSFSGIEIGLFSAGSLGPHFSYFTEIPVALENGETSIEIEDFHFLYTDVLGDGLGNLNFRLGKLRLFIPFIPNTLLSNAHPLVYEYSGLGEAGSPANDLSFAEPTFAASAFGMLPQILEGLRWEVAFTGGTKSDIDLKSSRAVFASLNQTFYINNAPFRIGAMYYGGQQDITDTSVAPNPWTNKVTRAGFDAEIYDPWTKRFNLFGQFLFAIDDNTDNIGTSHRMDGGFVGLNIIVFPEKFYLYGRYDYMKAKESLDIQKQKDIGFRYHFLPNVVLTGVFTVTDETLPQTIDLTSTSVGLGVLLGF